MLSEIYVIDCPAIPEVRMSYDATGRELHDTAVKVVERTNRFVARQRVLLDTHHEYAGVRNRLLQQTSKEGHLPLISAY